MTIEIYFILALIAFIFGMLYHHAQKSTLDPCTYQAYKVETESNRLNKSQPQKQSYNYSVWTANKMKRYVKKNRHIPLFFYKLNYR